MRQVSIVNCDNSMILGDEIWVAETKAERMKGLLGTQCLLAGQGLLLRPCSGIHTFGMKYAIDVLFLDGDYRVVETVDHMGPMRIARSYLAIMVLELPAGMAGSCCTGVGHRLTVCAPYGGT